MTTEQDDLEVTEYEELLYSPYSDLRIFTLNNNSPILGILLQENEDSFLVGLPTRFSKDKESGSMFLEGVIPFPYFRIFKSSLFNIAPLYGVFSTTYTKYLQEVGLVNHPEFIDFLPDDFLEDSEEFRKEEYTSPANEAIEEKLQSAAKDGRILKTTKSIH